MGLFCTFILLFGVIYYFVVVFTKLTCTYLKNIVTNIDDWKLQKINESSSVINRSIVD